MHALGHAGVCAAAHRLPGSADTLHGIVAAHPIEGKVVRTDRLPPASITPTVVEVGRQARWHERHLVPL